MKKCAVFLIRISDNPISMWFAGRTYQSWTNAGYEVQIIEAVTPETMHDCGIDIKFAPIKVMGRQKRPFSETEKAVFYSHAKVLKTIAKKTNPAIVLEHDAELIKPLPDDIYDMDITALGCTPKSNGHYSQTPALSYLIYPKMAQRLYNYLTTIDCKGNVDAYINQHMKDYGSNSKHVHHVRHLKDNEIGNTIDHPFIEGLTDG